MTSVFLNYVNEGAHYLVGHAQENAVEETRNQRSDVTNNNNDNNEGDMLALHLNLTRQLTRNKNKDYNRKSLWVVTFFTIGSIVTQATLLLSVIPNYTKYRYLENVSIVLSTFTIWSFPAIVFGAGIKKGKPLLLLPWIFISLVYVTCLWIYIFLETFKDTYKNYDRVILLVFIGGLSSAQVPVPIKAFIYMDKSQAQNVQTPNRNVVVEEGDDASDIEQPPPRGRVTRSQKLTRGLRRTLRTRRPPTNIIVNRQHPPSSIPEDHLVTIPRAYSLFDLRTVTEPSADPETEPSSRGLPPSYSEAAGLDNPPPSYSETNIARVRLGPYIMLLDNNKIRRIRT